MSTTVPSLNLEPFTSKHFEDEADEIEALWAVTYAMPVIMPVRERRVVFIILEQRCAITVETWKGEQKMLVSKLFDAIEELI